MKYLVPSLLVLFTLMLGCSNDSSNEAITEDDCTEQDSTPTMVVVGGDTMNIKGKPVVNEPKTLAGRQKREEISKVKDEKCCTSVETMQLCCCDEIAKKYKTFLQGSDFKSAENLKSKDPFFLSCQEKDGGFDKKIADIGEEILGK